MILKPPPAIFIFIHRIISLSLITFALPTAGMIPPAPAPRERLLLDFGWRFHLGDVPDAGTRFDYPEVSDLAKTRLDQLEKEKKLAASDPPMAAGFGSKVSFVQPDINDSHWRKLNLPHDWAVELPFEEAADYKHGFKPIGPDFPQNSIGWYRHAFALPASDEGQTLWLAFEGVYRNALVWLNGHCLGRHLDGYSSFRYDISKFANYGGKNELVVRVDASRFQGWFYEGAGIYRHVWLVKTSPLHIAPDGIFVYSTFPDNVPKGQALIHLRTEVANRQKNTSIAKVLWQIVAPDGKMIQERGVHETSEISPDSQTEFSREIGINSPVVWSPESPNLYRLITTVESGGKTIDRKEIAFGIRTIAFDPDKGFLLNGMGCQIEGTCNHQDAAGVGIAVPDALWYYRLKKLKAMGCNAIRTSHDEVAPELLDACDRLGLLVMEENRRLDTNAETLDNLKEMIRRDRNHPSIFIWSLGNEEPLQGTDIGESMLGTMQALVHQLDPTRLCTVAMNGKWGAGFSRVIDVQGFNYGTKNIDAYHTGHPTQPEIGTETASTTGTRGIYTNNPVLGFVSAYGDEHPGWGAAPWQWWPYYSTHPFTSGGFVWTGFDYHGEPTPYKWPCISSQFGIMDTCGFPKDIYYYYQSWWQDKPVLHITPHWNWPGKEGKNTLVRVFSNCQEVELFLNGKSLGKQKMGPNWFLDWNVKYEPGELSAKGYKGDKLVAETKDETAGSPKAIQLSPDRGTIHADGEDCVLVTVAVTDAQSRVVPVADNLIHFALSGPGRIIGVGNGDPSCHEPDICSGEWQRRVFNGLAQVIIQSSSRPGLILLTAVSPGLGKDTLRIRCEPAMLTSLAH
ncbi:MAG TPA: beta-galactosidase GalA [Verrucomicrobiae bacterium]|nr:beta-galactosidase GalA [Verrucomicrobiae bacterium]